LLAFAKKPSLKVPLTLVFFMAAKLLEYFPHFSTLKSFTGIFFVLLGNSTLISRDQITFSKTMLILVGSYIEAVFIYDITSPGQAMYFLDLVGRFDHY